jgi:hypothetical protein
LSGTDCACGRPLQAGESRCPSCVRANQSSWKQAGAVVGGLGFLGVVLVKAALFVVSKGKIKPSL